MQAPSLRTLPPSVVCASLLVKPEAFLAEVTLRFTSAKNRCDFRADRLRPPSCPTLYPDTAPTSRCRARMSAPMVANYLGKPPETSACYFRLVVAAALLSFLRSAQAAAFLVLPTRRGLMNARWLACGAVIGRPFGQSGLFASGASAYSTPPPRCEATKSIPEQPAAQGKWGSEDSSINLH